jgi:hypothetical protein
VTESLIDAYRSFGGMEQSQVPWLIWLLENPNSPLALAGAIPLKEHDYLHILLNKGKSPEDEAFIIGFTMGNDVRLNYFHVQIFQWASRFLYPKEYQFTQAHLKSFEAGMMLGKRLPTKNLCRFDYSFVEDWDLGMLRATLKIDQVFSV